jgi:hypothetical protein
MGRVPIKKLPDLTHEILLERKEKKLGKSWGGGGAKDTHEWVERPLKRKQSV